jgi:hypothetical protein
MYTKPSLLALISISTLTLAFATDAKNCIKGKPCGNGCIALDKTCRIDKSIGVGDSVLRLNPPTQPGTIIHRHARRLPKVAVVTAESVNAKLNPQSKVITNRYRQGQRVFVYETNSTWARISNMQPDEWVKLDTLQLK